MQICSEGWAQGHYLVAGLGRHDIAADRALHRYADVAEARHVCRDSRQARFDDAVMLDLPMRDGRANVHTVAAADHAFHLTDTIERNDSGRYQSGLHSVGKVDAASVQYRSGPRRQQFERFGHRSRLKQRKRGYALSRRRDAVDGDGGDAHRAPISPDAIKGHPGAWSDQNGSMRSD